MNEIEKICASCGRIITYRKKWEKNWDEIKYCSDECRRNKNRFDFRDAILELLRLRGPHAVIAQVDVLTSSQQADAVLLEHARRSARLLAHEGKIELLQNGKVVDPTTFRGPVQMRLKR
jgi:hypothetical protein